MAEPIVWHHYPYYLESHHSERQKRPPPPELLDSKVPEKERKQAEDTTIVRAAYIEYQLLWDDFIEALRSVRGQRALHGYKRPVKDEPPLTIASVNDKLKDLTIAQDAYANAGDHLAALQAIPQAAQVPHEELVQASRVYLEAAAEQTHAQAAYDAAKRAKADEPDRQLFVRRWWELERIVMDLSLNAYVRVKNSRAHLPDVAYRESLLAMVFHGK